MLCSGFLICGIYAQLNQLCVNVYYSNTVFVYNLTHRYGNPYNKGPCLSFFVVKPKSNDVITLDNHTDNTSNINTKCIDMLYNRSILIACYCGGLCYHTSAYLRVINDFLALNHDAKFCSKHTEM